MFDARAFLDSNTTASTVRKLIPLDRGDTFPGVVLGVEARNGTYVKDGETKAWARLDLKVSIDDPYVKDALAVPEVTRFYGVMLDLDANGGYDAREGRNIKLGLCAKGLGLDPANFTPRDFIGRPAMFRVGYTQFKGETWDEITGLLPAA